MTLDPDAANLLEAFRASGRPPYDTMSPDEARAAYATGRAATVPEPRHVDEVRDMAVERSDGSALRMRLYRPKNATDGGGALIYLHGGGWVLGDLESHDGLCRHLAVQAGCTVLSVDYRLAPEHKFPAAVEDALAATAWVFEHAAELRIDPERIAIGGDSAGGTLATVTCLARLEAGLPLPCYQVLLYPAADLGMTAASHTELGEGYLLTRKNMEWFAGHYLPDGTDRSDWRVSPLRAPSLAGLPAAFVLTAGYDPLRDEGEAYAGRLAAAGVPVHMWRITGQIHGFLPMGKVMTCAQPVLDTIARHLAFHLA